MEKDLQQPAEAPQPAEDEFEIRPWVKYVLISFGLSVLVAVEFATYRVGYGRGYEEATASGLVKERVNAIAVENLHHFMQVASMSDERLLKMVQHYDAELAWIRDSAVRDEAEWRLGETLVERGQVEMALPMLRKLFERVNMTEVWARRSAYVARGVATAGLRDEALSYYRGAAERFIESGATVDCVKVYSEMVELLASSSSAGMEEVQLLDKLQQEMVRLGEASKELRSHVLAYMGHVYRANGQQDMALQCFERALAGMDVTQSPSVASAAVCYGTALLEKGDVTLAEKLLRDGVRRLGDSPNDAAFLIVALRDLARLEQERGKHDKALALLYRAEGAADGRISPESSFWLCLYDQRGWVHFSRGDYEQALSDFSLAVAQSAKEELYIQPLEGAGRCCIALGKAEDALRYLRRCVALRTTSAVQNPANMGRVQLLLGQACDLAGDTQAAAEAYAQAMESLPAATDQNPDQMYAMLGRAYALSQLKRWDAAADMWSRILEIAKDDSSFDKEAKIQLAHCRRHGADAPDESKLPHDSSH